MRCIDDPLFLSLQGAYEHAVGASIARWLIFDVETHGRAIRWYIRRRLFAVPHGRRFIPAVARPAFWTLVNRDISCENMWSIGARPRRATRVGTCWSRL